MPGLLLKVDGHPPARPYTHPPLPSVTASSSSSSPPPPSSSFLASGLYASTTDSLPTTTVYYYCPSDRRPPFCPVPFYLLPRLNSVILGLFRQQESTTCLLSCRTERAFNHLRVQQPEQASSGLLFLGPSSIRLSTSRRLPSFFPCPSAGRRQTRRKSTSRIKRRKRKPPRIPVGSPRRHLQRIRRRQAAAVAARIVDVTLDRRQTQRRPQSARTSDVHTSTANAAFAAHFLGRAPDLQLPLTTRPRPFDSGPHAPTFRPRQLQQALQQAPHIAPRCTARCTPLPSPPSPHGRLRLASCFCLAAAPAAPVLLCTAPLHPPSNCDPGRSYNLQIGRVRHIESCQSRRRL